jgi:hypothetical protein
VQLLLFVSFFLNSLGAFMKKVFFFLLLVFGLCSNVFAFPPPDDLFSITGGYLTSLYPMSIDSATVSDLTVTNSIIFSGTGDHLELDNVEINPTNAQPGTFTVLASDSFATTGDPGTGEVETDTMITSILIKTPQAVTTSNGLNLDAITSCVVLLTGPASAATHNIDLQDGDTAGQILTLIAAVNVDADQIIEVDLASDTTCTNCSSPITFNLVGENVTLIWLGTPATWVILSTKDLS